MRFKVETNGSRIRIDEDASSMTESDINDLIDNHEIMNEFGFDNGYLTFVLFHGASGIRVSNGDVQREVAYIAGTWVDRDALLSVAEQFEKFTSYIRDVVDERDELGEFDADPTD